MILWRLYYDNGKTYSNEDGSWRNAPEHGVVCVVVRDRTGQWGRFVNSGYAPAKVVVCEHCGKLPKGNDFYVMRPGTDEPYATSDTTPFEQYMADIGVDPQEYIKYGRQIPQLDWEAVMHAAVADPDFPRGTPRRRISDWK